MTNSWFRNSFAPLTGFVLLQVLSFSPDPFKFLDQWPTELIPIFLFTWILSLNYRKRKRGHHAIGPILPLTVLYFFCFRLWLQSESQVLSFTGLAGILAVSPVIIASIYPILQDDGKH